jgi:hypothetical protein
MHVVWPVKELVNDPAGQPVHVAVPVLAAYEFAALRFAKQGKGYGCKKEAYILEEKTTRNASN